jgi:DNA repair protein RadC
MQKSPYVIRDLPFAIDRSPFDEYQLMIRDLPAEEKPREKLLAQGPEALSIRDLTALLLVTGTVREDVLAMVHRIVQEYGEKSIFEERDASTLSIHLDIPLVKACQIVAVGELGRRLHAKNTKGLTVIRNAQDVYEYLADMRDLPKEQMRGLYLDSHSRVIRDEVISIGTVNANFVHPREVFHPALQVTASAIILAHNHPSGHAAASTEDLEITEQLIAAGKIMGIRILDHVIITKDLYTSVKADY